MTSDLVIVTDQAWLRMSDPLFLCLVHECLLDIVWGVEGGRMNTTRIPGERFANSVTLTLPMIPEFYRYLHFSPRALHTRHTMHSLPRVPRSSHTLSGECIYLECGLETYFVLASANIMTPSPTSNRNGRGVGSVVSRFWELSVFVLIHGGEFCIWQ